VSGAALPVPRFDHVRRRLPAETGVIAGVALLVAFFSWRSPFFFNADNFVNVLNQSAPLLIASFAMTFVILSGEIDLSIGAVVSLIGILVAKSMEAGYAWPLAVVVALVVGCLIGLVNGAVTVYGRIPSFIVTLGTYSVARGLSFALTGAVAVAVLDLDFLDLLAFRETLGLTGVVWIACVAFVLLHVVLTRTTFGKRVYAVGGNPRAAALSGVPVERVKIGVFVLAGALSGLAAIVLTARLGTGFVEGARGLELDAIAAVVLGGTAFSGGRGSLVRTLLGALLIGILNNGLTLLNVTSYYQFVIKGAIIIGAVLLDRWAR